MFRAFRSVHSESFERTQAENVAAKWERFARTAADLGETALWQTAKRGADRIRTLRDIDAIEAEHAALYRECRQDEGFSNVVWALTAL